ncbi:hypothetical protein [Sorangium sp. So ce1000]|uniref:hypothetical protein n=1 Tax=Sorangium sp. So ce1000 TaxID=3133325 RepID=UPI003F5F4F2B
MGRAPIAAPARGSAVPATPHDRDGVTLDLASAAELAVRLERVDAAPRRSSGAPSRCRSRLGSPS